VSTGTPEAARNHSRSRLASRAAPGLVAGVRAALAVAGAAGVLLVVLATFATVIEITVAGNADITADIDRTASGWDRHNVALILLAGFALVMLVGALRGGRPAMFALATCGLAVLLIAVIGDAPDLDETGRIGELYEDARAEAGSGFYFETLGGALLLIAGIGLLVLGAGGVRLGGAGAPPAVEGEDEEPTTASAAASAAGTGAGAQAAAGAIARRAGAGAAGAVARARDAASERAQARRERAEIRRAREAAAQARARERAVASPAAPAKESPAEPTVAAEPAVGAEPTAPEPSAPEPAKLSFDERLRQARERAQRKP